MSINVLENTANINKETKLLVRFPKQATIFFKINPKNRHPRPGSPKSGIIRGLGNCVASPFLSLKSKLVLQVSERTAASG